MILALDIGNSFAKIASFDAQGNITQQWKYPTQSLASGLEEICATVGGIEAVGWISTAGRQAINQLPIWEQVIPRPRFYPVNALSKLPINLKYKTPETLGGDRIVAAIAACSLQPGKPVLVIDAGTAITYDFVDASGCYLGGGIAPGIRMRFEALHHFTASLPLVEGVKKTPLIGDSTKSSIRSGVQNGALAEVEGIIDRYRDRFGPEVQVFLTGGDSSFFEMRLKKLNFASPNLVLEGIYIIVTYTDSL